MPEQKRRNRVMEIPNSTKLIEVLVSPKVVKEKEFVWQEIVAAMAELIKTQTDKAEKFMVVLLEFEGEIRLAPESDIPHAMSPRDMLKSLGIQTLSRWTGRKYIRAFERIYATTKSPMLAGIAKAYIDKLGGEPIET